MRPRHLTNRSQHTLPALLLTEHSFVGTIEGVQVAEVSDGLGSPNNMITLQIILVIVIYIDQERLCTFYRGDYIT